MRSLIQVIIVPDLKILLIAIYAVTDGFDSLMHRDITYSV